MMKSYTAYCMNEDGENMCMTREYNSKKDFMSDLHGNGYKVHFIALTDKYDEESEKYHARLEDQRIKAAAKRSTKKMCRVAEKAIEEAEALLSAINANKTETAEEPQQEKKNMTAFRDFLTIMTKERNGEIQADCDAEYTVKNATDEKTATKYALEKLLKALETMGTKAAETVADIIRMNLKNDEFTADCNFNEIQNGGNAYEIEINPGFSDNTLWIYIRIAEYMHEEPAADQEPEENENYIAWCGMIDNDVITDEFETLSEAVDEVETKYNKDEMKAAGITFCKLLCNSGQWLECLEEKKVDDVYYF